MEHGVLGTASPPSLERTMGGARSYPGMAAATHDNGRAGAGLPSSGKPLGQDLHMTPKSHTYGTNLPETDEMFRKLTSMTCRWS